MDPNEMVDIFSDITMWRYSKNNEAKGPATTEAIITMYNNGELDDRCKVWDGEHVKEWTSIRKVPAFKNRISAPKRIAPPPRRQSMLSSYTIHEILRVNPRVHFGAVFFILSFSIILIIPITSIQLPIQLNHVNFHRFQSFIS